MGGTTCAVLAGCLGVCLPMWCESLGRGSIRRGVGGVGGGGKTGAHSAGCVRRECLPLWSEGHGGRGGLREGRNIAGSASPCHAHPGHEVCKHVIMCKHGDARNYSNIVYFFILSKSIALVYITVVRLLPALIPETQNRSQRQRQWLSGCHCLSHLFVAYVHARK